MTEHDDLSKICYKCKKAGHLSRDCPDHPDAKDNAETTASKRVNSNNTSQHKWKNDLPSNVVESGSTMIEDDDDSHAVAEVEKEKVNDLSYFTGCPLPDDVLFYAVPVCRHYNALQAYKYRVKITPGTLKKGKAAKTAMNLFVHMQDVTVREKELMKTCTDPELVAEIIGNVKITAAGLTQLKQRQKKVKEVGKEDS